MIYFQVEEESAQIADDKRALLKENSELKKTLTVATETIRNLTSVGANGASDDAASVAAAASDSDSGHDDVIDDDDEVVKSLKHKIVELTLELQLARQQVSKAFLIAVTRLSLLGIS